jgi:hypothetical protein
MIGATTMPAKHESVVEPLDDAVDHVRGPATGTLIVEYGDYEIASGEVRGTPTLFIDGAVHRAGDDTATLLAVLAR